MYLMLELIIIIQLVSVLSNNHIPEAVYDNLVKTVHKYLPLLHRYTKLRKELLGIEDLKCMISTHL